MTTAELIEYVRTMVSRDTAANKRVEQKLDAEGWTGAPVFYASCFYLAVNRRFPRPVDPGDIVRFVAEIRAWAGEDAPGIDPAIAETLIGSVVDPSMEIDVRRLDQEMVGRIELIVVFAVLSRLSVSEAELDAFFTKATSMAAAD